MEKEDHIDRALVFMENLEKLGEQLHNAQQQLILTMEHMLAMEQNRARMSTVSRKSTAEIFMQ